MRKKFGERTPGSSSTCVHGKPHMNSQQRALSNGTGRKTVISQLSEPAMSALMVNVRIKPKRNQKVSVQEPGHLSSSCSTARTSAAVIRRRPRETLSPDREFRLERAGRGFASAERRSSRL